MKSKLIVEFLKQLPENVREYICQDVMRWSSILNYEHADAFEAFYNTRQEFRSVIRYRARIAEKIFAKPGILNRIIQIHGNSPSAWVSNLYLSCQDIGPGLYIEHGFSTIIFAKSIGRNFYVNQNVTIGTGKGGNPTICDNVRVGANSIIIGDILVPNGVKVGAGAVLNFEVPENSTVVSQRARVIS